MPYWSIFCLYCSGYIADALLECVPSERRAAPEFLKLFHREPGAAIACPYCGKLIGFDVGGEPCVPESGWAVFRYGMAELDLKRASDGEGPNCSLQEWAGRHRFTSPGSHLALAEYTYAEHAPPNETVP